MSDLTSDIFRALDFDRVPAHVRWTPGQIATIQYRFDVWSKLIHEVGWWRNGTIRINTTGRTVPTIPTFPERRLTCATVQEAVLAALEDQRLERKPGDEGGPPIIGTLARCWAAGEELARELRRVHVAHPRYYGQSACVTLPAGHHVFEVSFDGPMRFARIDPRYACPAIHAMRTLQRREHA